MAMIQRIANFMFHWGFSLIVFGLVAFSVATNRPGSKVAAVSVAIVVLVGVLGPLIPRRRSHRKR
jgi:hypothetical protein